MLGRIVHGEAEQRQHFLPMDGTPAFHRLLRLRILGFEQQKWLDTFAHVHHRTDKLLDIHVLDRFVDDRVLLQKRLLEILFKDEIE